MSVPGREEILALLKQGQQKPCLSVFMCTDRLGADTQQNPVRLKNLLRDAEERLASRGMRAPDMREMLAPAYDLLEQSPFWRHLNDGLALYATQGFFRTYTVPLSLDERIVVGNRFCIKPLLPLLVGDGRFYVLALSQGGVRLFEGSRDSMTPVELQGVPASLQEFIHADEAAGTLQFRNQAQQTGGPMASGSGTDDNNAKRNIVQYFGQVDRVLRRAVEDEQAPLVVAGVEYLLPLYREANSYTNIVKQDLATGVELMDGQQLHDRAWRIVEPMFTADRNKAIELYRQLDGEASSKASEKVDEVVLAAYYGRVGTLLVALDAQQWGHFDASTGTVKPAESGEDGAEDLLDTAALYTLKNKGTVYTLKQADMPAQGPVAALMRY